MPFMKYQLTSCTISYTSWTSQLSMIITIHKLSGSTWLLHRADFHLKCLRSNKKTQLHEPKSILPATVCIKILHYHAASARPWKWRWAIPRKACKLNHVSTSPQDLYWAASNIYTSNQCTFMRLNRHNIVDNIPSLITARNFPKIQFREFRSGLIWLNATLHISLYCFHINPELYLPFTQGMVVTIGPVIPAANIICSRFPSNNAWYSISGHLGGLIHNDICHSQQDRQCLIFTSLNRCSVENENRSCAYGFMDAPVIYLIRWGTNVVPQHPDMDIYASWLRVVSVVEL